MLTPHDIELMAEYCVKYAISNGVPASAAPDAAQELFAYYQSNEKLTGPGGLRSILGEKYPEYFCKAYLSDQFDREFGDYAIEILHTFKNVVETPSREKQAVTAPRGHGKSTLDSFAMPTWCACYQKKQFILFISANYDTSKNFLGKVRKALESQEITEDFGVQSNNTAWSAEELCTKNGVWIKCAGWRSGLRGMNKDTRPDLIILDDLEDKDVIQSTKEQKRLDICFNEEIGRLGDYRTDLFYIGTLLSEDSLLARTMKNPAWRSSLFKRVISFPTNNALWDEWRKIYCDITNQNRFDDAWKFYETHKSDMLKGSKILWENKVPPKSTQYPGGYYNVMLDRVGFGEDAFWQEDQSEPAKASDKPFKSLTFWNEKYKGEEFKKALQNITLGIDPSEGKGFDGTAYGVGGKINRGVGILEGQLRNDALAAIMAHTAWFLQTYPEIQEIIIEENTYKEDGTNQLREYLAEHGFTQKVAGFRSEGISKYNRIMQMEPDVNSGQILFNQNNVDFNTEVIRFSASCSHDDAPDVTHVLWKKFKGSATSAFVEYARMESERLAKEKTNVSNGF
jgi:hypothetical protein